MPSTVETRYMYYGETEIPVECFHEGDKVYLTENGLYAALKSMIGIMIDQAQKRNLIVEPVITSKISNSATTASVLPVPEPEILPVDPNEWTQDKIDKMVGLKKKMGITDNEQLNQWVYEWSNGNLNSYENIIPSNVDSFVEYVNKEI